MGETHLVEARFELEVVQQLILIGTADESTAALANRPSGIARHKKRQQCAFLWPVYAAACRQFGRHVLRAVPSTKPLRGRRRRWCPHVERIDARHGAPAAPSSRPGAETSGAPRAAPQRC